jgi:molybdate transport system regulatory protein
MANPKTAKPGNKPSRQRVAGYNIRARIWVEKDGELYLGWGRIMLLEQLNEIGSIAGAARSMGLTYRNAWLWIESMNLLAPSPLVEKSIGGSSGGYAKLTDEGRKAVAFYKELHTSLDRLLEHVAPCIDQESGIPHISSAP